MRTIEYAQNKPAPYFANLGVAYLYSKQYDKAKDVCIQGLQLYPRDIDIQGNLTLAYINLDMYDDAVLSAQKRLRMGRDIHAISEAASVSFTLGYYLRNTDFPKAIENYITSMKLDKEAICLNSNYINNYYNLANTQYHLKLFNDSSTQIIKIKDIQKRISAHGAFILARNILWTSAIEGAYHFTERMLKTFPNDIPLKRIRAEALADGYSTGYFNNDYWRIIEQSSLNFFDTIIEDKENRTPSDIIYLAKYYIWLAENNKLDDAIKVLKWGMDTYINDWRFDFYLASCYMCIYNNSQALHYAQSAIQKAPWKEKSYELCAQIYRKLGDTAKAQEMQDKAKEIKAIKDKLYAEAKQV